MGSLAVGRIFGREPPGILNKGDPSLVLPETYMGLEFEIENYRHGHMPEDLLNYWRIKEDHSLRNAGMEFVFNGPMFGKDITTAVDSFLSWQKGTKIQTSVRTGLHVHLDVRSLPVDSLVSFMALYTALEPLIYKWVGDNREESNFCVPYYYSQQAFVQAKRVMESVLQDEQDFFKKATAAAPPPPNPLRAGGIHRVRLDEQPGGYARGVSAAIDEAQRYDRYAGLNLQSLSRFGSVEFRHMKMTFDRGRIMKWINLILALKKEAMGKSVHDVSGLLRKHEYKINDVAKLLCAPLSSELSGFQVADDVRCDSCRNAEEFTRIGRMRKWRTTSKKKYLSQTKREEEVTAYEPVRRRVEENVIVHEGHIDIANRPVFVQDNLGAEQMARDLDEARIAERAAELRRTWERYARDWALPLDNGVNRVDAAQAELNWRRR